MNNDFNLGLFVLFCVTTASFLTWITKLRRENKTLKKTVKFQKQIIDGKTSDNRKTGTARAGSEGA